MLGKIEGRRRRGRQRMRWLNGITDVHFYIDFYYRCLSNMAAKHRITQPLHSKISALYHGFIDRTFSVVMSTNFYRDVISKLFNRTEKLSIRLIASFNIYIWLALCIY